MGNFCSKCGTTLADADRFCGECGSARLEMPAAIVVVESTSEPIEPDAVVEVATAEAQSTPPSDDYWEGDEDEEQADRKPLFIGLAIGGALLAALLAYQFGPSAADDYADDAAEASATLADGELPADWFETYEDDFLSPMVEAVVTGQANMRDFPTSRETQVVEELNIGAPLQGRWVTGADPTTRWFKAEGRGYLWERNVMAEGEIRPQGMGIFVAGVPVQRWIEPDGLLGDGHYGAQDKSWDAQFCEIYNTHDGNLSILAEGYLASSVGTSNASMRTREGIAVGATLQALRDAYGSALSSSENPYAGTDYFIWPTEEFGIKFQVENGRIISILAGNSAVRYVEGCL